MHSNDNDMLFLLLMGLIGLLWLLSRRIRRMLPTRRMPLNMENLRWIAYRKSLLCHMILVPPVLLLACACYVYGRTGILASILLAAALLLYPLLSALMILRLQRKPLQSLPADLVAAMERQLQGKELIHSQGAWGYIDSDWYICVGKDICIVLWAKCIDFSIPVRQRIHQVRGGGTKSGMRIKIDVSEFLLQCQDGSTIIAYSQSTQLLKNWIKKHAGRFE